MIRILLWSQKVNFFRKKFKFSIFFKHKLFRSSSILKSIEVFKSDEKWAAGARFMLPNRQTQPHVTLCKFPFFFARNIICTLPTSEAPDERRVSWWRKNCVQQQHIAMNRKRATQRREARGFQHCIINLWRERRISKVEWEFTGSGRWVIAGKMAEQRCGKQNFPSANSKAGWRNPSEWG